MTKITTADCRKFLTTDPKVQDVVQGRYDIVECEVDDPEEIKYFNKVLKDAKIPKRWKRRTKYKIGSETDRMGGDVGGGSDYANSDYIKQSIGFDPVGGVIREFWLEGTDHVTVAILEKDGVLTLVDDLSD